MAEKLIVLITGANQGIGYQAAQQFADTGKHHVLLGSRDQAKGQKAVDDLVANGTSKDNVEVVQLDVTSDDSIEAAAKTITERHGRLDILVHNAAVSSAPGGTREHWQQLYNTNVFGVVVCTEALAPLLRQSTAPGGKRLIFVSSGVGVLTWAADPAGRMPGKLWPIYRSSKAALNMVMLYWADVLAPEGFVVGGICPGYCGTALNDFTGAKSAADGAKVILMAAQAEGKDVHAKVVNEDGPYPW